MSDDSSVQDRLLSITSRLVEDIVFLSTLIGAGREAGAVSVKIDSLSPMLQNARKNLDELLVVQREIKQDEAAVEFYRQMAAQREEIDARIRAEREKASERPNPSPAKES